MQVVDRPTFLSFELSLQVQCKLYIGTGRVLNKQKPAIVPITLSSVFDLIPPMCTLRKVTINDSHVTCSSTHACFNAAVVANYPILLKKHWQCVLVRASLTGQQNTSSDYHLVAVARGLCSYVSNNFPTYNNA